MTTTNESGMEPTEEGQGGREGDRRGNDRRAVERRAPAPPWRRPWALVAYGVLGGLAAVLLISSLTGSDKEKEAPAGELVTAPNPRPAAPSAAPVADRGASPEDAYGAKDFERLVIEADAAVGRRVRAELFCEAPSPVATRKTEQVQPAIAALADTEGRVPAAECKWGRRDDARREDFLLLVPPELAEQFTAAPVTGDGFLRRRRLVAEVEWIGQSSALALRKAGILRGINPAS